MIIGPDGHPIQRPVPGRPGGGLPPGFNPRAQPAHAEPEEEHAHAKHEEHEEPDALPPPVNWWHGIMMVNNERAAQGGFVNQLLFRYENPKNHADPKNEPPPFLASTAIAVGS